MFVCRNYFVRKTKHYSKSAVRLVQKRSSYYKSFNRTMCSVDSECSNNPDHSKPEEPKEEDCCHSGCQNCVFDVYLKALERWKTSKSKRDPSLRYDLLSITQFKPFVLVDIKSLSCDTNLYTFKPYVEGTTSFIGSLPYSAGQYLALRVDKPDIVTENQSSSHLIRDFTILSLSEKMSDCSFEVLVKLYEGSLTSNFIKSLKLGEKTFWRGPYGDFKYKPNTYSHLIMFCMGTGIAPMYPIINEIISNEADETLVHLHFGCRNSDEIILRNEIKDFMSFWNFNCTYYLPDEKEGSNKNYSEKFVFSKINEECVRMAVEHKDNFFVLVCGSQQFNNDVKTALEMLNIEKNNFFLF